MFSMKINTRHSGGRGVLAVLVWACVTAAMAQTPVRIGVTKIVSHAALDADEKGFKAGLESSGFKEGVHVVYDSQNAQGDPKKAESIARQFVADKVTLIHAISTPSAQAVVKATQKIPVVFSSITDPISAGIVPPQSKPGQKTGTHVTGVSDLWPVFLQMQTYAQLVPHAKTWGTIYNPAEANSMMHIQAMREAATRLKLTLVEAKISNSSEVATAAQGLVGQVQAFTITSDNTTVANLEALVKVAEQHKVPLFAGDVDSVHRGAIAAFGMDYFLVGYAAGKKAALILKGVKPGDIPWGPMEKFSLVINTKAAQAQGVTLSADQLRRADKVLN
jgi:putative tryptophan/tyrosine transport system substrate-binding protein